MKHLKVGETLIDEVFVLNEGGIPIFYYNRHEKRSTDDRYISISSLLSAMSSFANDLAADNIKFLVMQNRSFALSKTLKDYLVVFGEFGPAESADLAGTEVKLLKSSEVISSYLQTNFPEGTIGLTSNQMNQITQDMTKDLKKEGVIDDQFSVEDDYSSRQMGLLGEYISKTVGYTPGVCNIGEKERLIRLISGFAFLFLGVLLLLGLVFLENNYDFPREARFLVAIPFFFGFQGFYQYFFRFCVTNALRRKYVMR